MWDVGRCADDVGIEKRASKNNRRVRNRKYGENNHNMPQLVKKTPENAYNY